MSNDAKLLLPCFSWTNSFRPIRSSNSIALIIYLPNSAENPLAVSSTSHLIYGLWCEAVAACFCDSLGGVYCISFCCDSGAGCLELGGNRIPGTKGGTLIAQMMCDYHYNYYPHLPYPHQHFILHFPLNPPSESTCHTNYPATPCHHLHT